MQRPFVPLQLLFRAVALIIAPQRLLALFGAHTGLSGSGRAFIISLFVIAIPNAGMSAEVPIFVEIYDSGPVYYSSWGSKLMIYQTGNVVLSFCRVNHFKVDGCRSYYAQLNKLQLQTIRDAVVQSQLVERPAQESTSPRVGGGGWIVYVYKNNAKVITTPDTPDADDEARVNILMNALRKAIPEKLIKVMEGPSFPPLEQSPPPLPPSPISG